jgi:hypothetical protein
MHDLKLWQFRHRFNQLSHPIDSIMVASDNRFGLLVGNSNHCDFFAGQIRWTQLSETEVELFYSSHTISATYPNRQVVGGFPYTNVTVRIIPVEDDKITIGGFSCPIPYELCDLSNWKSDMSTYQQGEGMLYVVYALDVGYSPFWDMRCH